MKDKMQENKDLQNQMNEILRTSNQPQTPANQTTQLSGQMTQASQTIPETSAPDINSQIDLSHTAENYNQGKNLLIFIPPAIIAIMILIILLIRYTGPRSYEACIKDPESEIYTLEPIFCTNKRGVKFFKDGVPAPDPNSVEYDSEPAATTSPQVL